MRVAIDIRTLTQVRSGVGNYVLHLLRGLKEVAPEVEYQLVAQPRNLAALGWPPGSAQALLARLSHENHPLGDLWEHFRLPRELNRARTHVLHGPAFLIPLTSGEFGTVATIHDLVAFLYPETIPKKYALYMRWLLKAVVKRADRLISVSHNTKRDLVQVLGVDPAQVEVIHEAAHPGFRPIDDQAALDDVRRRYGLPERFVYHVGNIEPRKNLVRLVTAFMLARQELGNGLRLVITGQKGWLTGQLFRAMGDVDLSEFVTFTGYVPHADLPLLMNAAEVFTFPSLYEGFGLPVLEAMRCGTPVLTSNLSSLPEIVGDAAVQVDPEEPRDIARGLVGLLKDADLRRELSRRGMERAAEFTWQETARRTLEVYRDVARQRGVDC